MTVTRSSGPPQRTREPLGIPSSKLYKKQKPLREIVGNGIRSRTYSGDFPPGYRLAERDLADMFEVSRLPVREAIRVLQNEGLVQPLIARLRWLFRQVPDFEQLGAEHTALCDAFGSGDADAAADRAHPGPGSARADGPETGRHTPEVVPGPVRAGRKRSLSHHRIRPTPVLPRRPHGTVPLDRPSRRAVPILRSERDGPEP